VKIENHGKWRCSISGILAAVAILLIFPCLSRAGVYKFVDSQGIAHYTDNLLQVPEDQRPALVDEPVESEQPRKADAERADQSAKQKVAENKTLTSTKSAKASNTATAIDKLRLDRLQDKRRQLDGEYEAIMLEQERLSKMRDTLKTAKEKEMFTEAANRLNARINAYEKNRRALAAQIRQYNERVRHYEQKRKALEAEMASFTGSANGG